MQIKLQFLTLLWYCYLAYLSLLDLQPMLSLALIYLQHFIGFSYLFFTYLTRFNNEDDHVDDTHNDNKTLQIDSQEASLKIKAEECIEFNFEEENKLKSLNETLVTSDKSTLPCSRSKSFTSFSPNSPSCVNLNSTNTTINKNKTNSLFSNDSELNFFSFQDFTFQLENDLLFGSGFIPISQKKKLSIGLSSSTSYPHILSWSSGLFSHDVMKSKKVVLTLLPELKAKEIQFMMDFILPYLMQAWMPIYKLHLLKETWFYLCTPYFPINVSKFLQKQKKFKLKEATCLTLFILIHIFQLEQMSMGFQFKFSFDYVFLKDEKVGISFDNLVLGGYHAITLLDPIPTSIPTPIHPSYFRFLNALLIMTEHACEQPFHFACWAFPLKQLKNQLQSIQEFHQILYMLSVDILPSNSSTT